MILFKTKINNGGFTLTPKKLGVTLHGKGGFTVPRGSDGYPKGITYRSKAEGFTLAETLVVLSLFGIILIAVVSLYFGHSKLAGTETKLGEHQGRLGASLGRVLTLANQAAEVLDQATVDSVNYTSSDSTIVLSLPTIDSEDNVISDSSDILIFSEDANGDFVAIVSAAVGSKRASGQTALLEDIESAEINYSDELNPEASDWFELELAQIIATAAGDKTISQTVRVHLKNKQ